MNIGTRIKVLRKSLKFTQAEFGEKIGLKATAIGLYESGDRNVTDRNIAIICSTYNISEQWLRTGEGEMFVQTDGSLLAQVSEEYKLSPEHRIVIESFLNLDNSQRDAIVSYVSDLADQFKSSAQAKSSASTK